jgi:hypothetical protein
MRTKFASAADYLAYLQELFTRRYADDGPVDDEFQRLTETALRNAGIEIPRGHLTGLNSVISKLWDDVLECLNDSQRDEISRNIAAGVVENGEANAFIARSPDGKYAVIFNSGLAMFLHKLFKLTAGWVDPSCVTYCNRKDARNLTKSEMRVYIDEFISYFREEGVPRGPLIKLTSEASGGVSFQLISSEIFILCHELGHYLNGDLSDERSYAALPSNMPGSVYEENKDHEIEHRADCTGFGIYRKAVAKIAPKLSGEMTLHFLLGLFNAFYSLSKGASRSHPHPYERVIRIAHAHFGSSLANRYGDALENPALLSNLFDSIAPSELRGATRR